MSYWIVLERTWEYNDEWYYTTQDEAGIPKNVFLDKATAEGVCDARNKERLEGLSIHEFAEDWYSNFRSPDYSHLIDGDIERYKGSIKENLTDEEMREVGWVVGKYPFYFVHEVKPEDG